MGTEPEASGFQWHSFGRCQHGELGRRVVSEGVEVPGLENADVRPLEVPTFSELACGHFHTLARSSTGEIFVWGANGESQLGLGADNADEAFVSAPCKADALQSLQESGETVSHFAAGRSHSVFVTSPGGRCFISGRLPTAEPSSSSTRRSEVREIQLTDSSAQPQGKIVSCAAGETSTFFLSSDGEVWSWLGEEAAYASRAGRLDRPTARAVPGLPKVTEVVCGFHHTLVLTEERDVFAFGAGALGQLGLGGCRRCPSPGKVSFPAQCSGGIKALAAGFASSFAVTQQGWVYSWGSNEKCELGLGASVRGAATPKPVDALYQVKVMQVAAGFSHAACVTEGGLLYLWGFGAYGQLGFGFDDLRSSARLGAGWSATKLGGRAASSPGSAGFATTGQTQPWQQVWPRRCLRGPFRKRVCLSVHCGAYHTMAQASTQPLSTHALKESEVLCPLPNELSDLPAAGFAPEEVMDHVLPPGAGSLGLVECPRPALRSTGGPRATDIFRSLSSLFWDTRAPEQKPDSIPAGAPLPNCARDGAWRRALRTAGAPCRAMPEHPLMAAERHTTPKGAARLEPLPLPGPDGIATWDEVDEVVHRAFSEGRATDRASEIHLADLVTNLSEISGVEWLGDSDGLPPSPCRGLARLECLTPRPFYLPDQEAAKAWLNVHAPAPEEGSPGSRSGPRSDEAEEGAEDRPADAKEELPEDAADQPVGNTQEHADEAAEPLEADLAEEASEEVCEDGAAEVPAQKEAAESSEAPGSADAEDEPEVVPEAEPVESSEVLPEDSVASETAPDEPLRDKEAEESADARPEDSRPESPAEEEPASEPAEQSADPDKEQVTETPAQPAGTTAADNDEAVEEPGAAEDR